MATVPNVYLSEMVLVITAAVLLYVAQTDLRYYKVRNEFIFVLVALFIVHALVSGRWVSAPGNAAFAFLMFVSMFFLYSRHLMGGGDVKLLSVAFLWVGISCALPFALLLLLFVAIHTVAVKLGWADSRRTDNDDRRRIPIAPTIAAALIGVFMLGCLA